MKQKNEQEEYYKFPDDCRDVPIPTEPIDVMKGTVFESPTIEEPCCSDACGCKTEISNLQALKMILSYMFIREEVIEPIKHKVGDSEAREFSTNCRRRKLFKWQKLPEGYERLDSYTINPH